MNSFSITTCDHPPIIIERNEECIQVIYADGFTQTIMRDIRITIAVGVGCAPIKAKQANSNGVQA
jgi:hypothetical protein